MKNENTPRIAAAYVRQSKNYKTMSSADQLAEIRRLAEMHGITLFQDLVFADDNIGTTGHREGYEELKEAARNGTLQKRGVNVLLFWCTDRITHNLRELVAFEAEMARSGITCLPATELLSKEVAS